MYLLYYVCYHMFVSCIRSYVNLLFVSYVTEQTCTAEDQVYSLNAPDCVPTCSDPNPSCSGTTQDCICPNGIVVDNIQNRCVPLSKCSKNIIILMTNHNNNYVHIIISFYYRMSSIMHT